MNDLVAAFPVEDLLNLACLLPLDLIEVGRCKSGDTPCNFNPPVSKTEIVSSILNSPRTSRTPEGRRLVCLLSKAFFAPSSTTTVPFESETNPIHFFLTFNLFFTGKNSVPEMLPKKISVEDAGFGSVRNHHRNPRRDTLFRGLDFCDHPSGTTIHSCAFSPASQYPARIFRQEGLIQRSDFSPDRLKKGRRHR